MPAKIVVKVGKIRLNAELYDSSTAREIVKSLPIESEINTWGDEFYFKAPVEHKLDETATKVVKVGDIGYWPPDNAICIFFGPTPASNGPEPVPASAVNLIGRITDDPRLLKKAMKEKKIILELIEE